MNFRSLITRLKHDLTVRSKRNVLDITTLVTNENRDRWTEIDVFKGLIGVLSSNHLPTCIVSHARMQFVDDSSGVDTNKHKNKNKVINIFNSSVCFFYVLRGECNKKTIGSI